MVDSALWAAGLLSFGVIIQSIIFIYNGRRMKSQLKTMKSIEHDIEVFRAALILSETMRECYHIKNGHSDIKYRLAIYEQMLLRAENSSKQKG